MADGSKLCSSNPGLRYERPFSQRLVAVKAVVAPVAPVAICGHREISC